MGISAFQIEPLPDDASTRRLARRGAPGREAQNERQTGLLSEESFLALLALERKRAERSRKPFVVMLADLEDAFGGAEPEWILGEIVEGLSASTRDTDITGWYSAESVIGTIFTEVGNLENGAMDKMRDKVSSALSQRLSPELFNRIQLSFYRFPEEWGRHKPGQRGTPRLYPDVVERNNARKFPLLLKRFLDIAGSIAGLILFSPLFLLISLAIKLTSKGPVLFRQERVGKHGVPFGCLKFRTMHVNNDPKIHQEYVAKLIRGDAALTSDSGVFKITNDPRVSAVGQLLRKCSFDELPQFINVLKGEMSLVGPRPPIPYELEAYDLWHRRRVFEAKPGITGLWQVKGRSRTTFDEMVRLDLRYSRSWSLWLDFKILLETPRAVFSGKGAL
jgi:lipopolysaccharide/colanic/teichoic acid biosynthesis glycosyltransferase